MAPGTGFTHTCVVTPGAALAGNVENVGAEPGPVVDTNTVMEAQAVMLQVPSILAKYVDVALGETVMDVAPLNAGRSVPPQVPVYHLQFAPAPRVPPLTVKVMFSPAQMLLKSRLEVIEEGSADVSNRVTTKLAVDMFP
jgi:hypothetical protein